MAFHNVLYARCGAGMNRIPFVNQWLLAGFIAGFGGILSGCSINRFVMTKAADALCGGSAMVFSADDDVELVGDALPFSLKLYESILDATPKHPGLLLAAGKLCVTYAFAYIQTPAEMLGNSDIDRQIAQRARAKRMYLRGARYCMRGLESAHPGFATAFTGADLEGYLQQEFTKKEDAQALYWTGMAWMGAYSLDNLDIELSITTTRAVKLIARSLQLDEAMDGGAIHEFFISYYGALPTVMGGSETKAREHFRRAVELSHGLKAGPYVNLAATVCVTTQNRAEFIALLNKALAIDANADPANRLVNCITQKKARWMVDHIENYFLSE
jgi:predicted anti-sigma-YlaC factor YlaD